VLLAALPACSSPNSSQPAAPAPASAPAPAADRKWLLERVDDAAVVQLYADGFKSLPLKQKTLIYHLYMAALAGRDIYIDQKHKDALAMRAVVERIVANPNGVDAKTLEAVQRYAKLFWLNNGPYNNLTARKFVLTCTPQEFAAAAKAAGVPEAEVARLQPMFFDPNVDPIVTNKTPGPGKDILQSSANNLYSGVTMADHKGYNEKYGLNSRLVKQNG
jgi:dipeptidyl-peptidase-3